MSLALKSPCKINLLLNILRKQEDGYHELETVMQPVPIFDELEFQRGGTGIQLRCSDPALPTDSRNLVVRAAELFFASSGTREGVRIQLEKRVPLAAGLGGGSANAATTLRGLNQLLDHPLAPEQIGTIATRLGSDVPFFLQDQPALGLHRGELVQPLEAFAALHGKGLLLIHPGFGVSTPWAYRNLARFPSALNGTPGRARQLIEKLRTNDLRTAAGGFYNSLEAPVLDKHPILRMFQEFLLANGALVALMSGSGSTTFAITETQASAELLGKQFAAKYPNCWIAHVELK